MKNIKIKLLALSLILTMSCDTDDNTNDSTRTASNPMAALNLNFSESTIFNEGDENTLTYTINLDEPQIADIIVNVSFVDGTATEDVDFSYQHSITISAYQTAATGTITIIKDTDYEPTETFTLRVGDERTANVNFTPVEFTVQIGNYEEDDLTIDLSWDGTFTGLGGETDFCDIDMDLELFDSNGDYVDTSYSDCPEQIVMPVSLPDDTYTLTVSLWDSNDETEIVDIPANLSIYKVGTLVTYAGDLSTYFPLANGGLANGNGSAFLDYTIVKSGTTFTVTDNNSNQVLQGRMSNLSQTIKSKILNRNKK